jgi:hypothetical protein
MHCVGVSALLHCTEANGCTSGDNQACALIDHV